MTIQQELEALGNRIVADAKAYPVPVDTGALKTSLSSTPFYESISRFGVNINQMYYGVYVDKGTYKMKARPYLTTAIEKNVQTSINGIVEGVTAVLVNPIYNVIDKYKTK